MLTTLRWAIVLARGRGTRTSATSLLDAQCPALMNLALESLLGRISLLSGDHLDETEAAGVLCVRVAHDVALLNFAILLEQTRHLLLSQRRVNARDKEVRARVAAAWVVIFFVASWGWAAAAG
jgi:hypothetical protein